MVHVKQYHLPPTALVPNSPLPLLHYPGLLLAPNQTTTAAGRADADADAVDPAPTSPVRVYDLFSRNGWQVQWIFRYGPTQDAHYHAAAHEAMAVLSGEATIRFGAADADDDDNIMSSPPAQGEDDDNTPSSSTSDNNDNSKGSSSKPPPPLELRARAGDVFILPAGVAHKTFDTRPPSGGLKLLTPGDGHHISGDDEDPRQCVERVRLDGGGGFTMMGAYPLGGGAWDFNTGGEHRGRYGEVWDVPRPARDPVLGEDPDGLCGLWRG